MADDFKVKVTADLDTSQLEAKLNALQNKKMTIRADVNGNGINNLDNSIQQVQNRANDLSASFKVHIPQELRIRSRGTERHSASN